MGGGGGGKVTCLSNVPVSSRVAKPAPSVLRCRNGCSLEEVLVGSYRHDMRDVMF